MQFFSNLRALFLGLISTFDGECLGECRGFEIGTDNMDWDSSMVLLHDGMKAIFFPSFFLLFFLKQYFFPWFLLGFDGGKFDWAVFTTDEFLRIRCDFKNFLESGDYEVGKDCRECFNDCYEWRIIVIWKNQA